MTKNLRRKTPTSCGPGWGAGLRRDKMADAAPTVTFPDDYPNSVRHFLLIGFLGMFIGSIVFFYMGISRKVNTVSHVLTFFIAAVASCSYYAMWAGLGVEYKTTDTTPRVIFWARYLDWIITLPVIRLALEES
jgi:bacteriorhodopsin